MGLEHMHFPAAEGPKEIEANGFTITLRLAENPDYSYVTLRRDGIAFETVIRNDTGALEDGVDIDTEPENLVRARYLAIDIPAAIQVALGLAAAEAPTKPPAEDGPFWSTPEATRIAQAEALARQRGDHRADVQ